MDFYPEDVAVQQLEFVNLPAVNRRLTLPITGSVGGPELAILDRCYTLR